MPTNELKRLTSDLSTIQQAMRLDKRYAWDDVLGELVTALGGLLAMLLLVFTPLDQRIAFTLGIVPVILYGCWSSAQRWKNKANRPSLWLEDKVMFQALAIVMPLMISWLAWRRITVESTEWPGAGAPAIFFFGVGLTYVGIIDSNRRRFLAGSVTLMVWSLAMPSLTSHQFSISCAVVLVVASLGQAAIILWQLKRDRVISAGTEEIR